MWSKGGLIFIVSAPAGTGKTTLVERWVQECPRLHQTVSCVTRKPRKGEKEGQHYHFISREEFEKRIAKREFLEYVELFGDYYGTPKKEVEKWVSKGEHALLVIDTQGAEKIKKKFDSVSIFIHPPTFETLKKRLEKRGSECADSMSKRLLMAKLELKEANRYTYQIINDDFETALGVLKSILIAEEHKSTNIG